jgi:hypothetical protein
MSWDRVMYMPAPISNTPNAIMVTETSRAQNIPPRVLSARGPTVVSESGCGALKVSSPIVLTGNTPVLTGKTPGPPPGGEVIGSPSGLRGDVPGPFVIKSVATVPNTTGASASSVTVMVTVMVSEALDGSVAVTVTV